MSTIDELEVLFRASFEDQILSRNEKRGLKEMLAAARLDQRKRDILRSKVYDLAKNGLAAHDPRFVLDWVEDASRLLEEKLEEEGTDDRVYFSPGPDCLDAILTQLQTSRKSIDICVFTISDDRITREIIARHRMHVPVRIITDNDKLYDAGSDIGKLADAGIEVRVDKTDKHMHHKFAVLDDARIITGSYNWTRSAEAYNEENILITESPSAVRAYNREFDRLWDIMVPYYD